MTIVVKPVSGYVSRGRAVSLRPFPRVWEILRRVKSSHYRCRFPHGTEGLVTGGRAATAAVSSPPGTEALIAGGRVANATAERPHRSRTWVTGIGCLGKGEVAKGCPSVTGVVCEISFGSETFATVMRAAITARLYSGQQKVYLEETRLLHASVNPKQELGGPAALENP